MMKLHEWAKLDPREAEEEAELQANLDSESAGLKTDQWQNKKEGVGCFSGGWFRCLLIV
jgi:hypothetical protein